MVSHSTPQHHKHRALTDQPTTTLNSTVPAQACSRSVAATGSRTHTKYPPAGRSKVHPSGTACRCSAYGIDIVVNEHICCRRSAVCKYCWSCCAQVGYPPRKGRAPVSGAGSLIGRHTWLRVHCAWPRQQYWQRSVICCPHSSPRRSCSVEEPNPRWPLSSLLVVLER